MSDENSNGSASSSEQTVPKSRLDELIAERNQERQERQFLQQQLSQLVQMQQRQVTPTEVDDPEMEQLKTENPMLYRKMKKQEKDLKQVRAGFSTVADQNDRLGFLIESGDEGRKRLTQVEQILENERRRGNFNVNRTGIFNWLLGQEHLQREQRRSQAPQGVPTMPQASAVDAPPTNPQHASTLAAGTASARTNVEKTRDEMLSELENIEF